jgi:hypothetical protein
MIELKKHNSNGVAGVFNPSENMPYIAIKATIDYYRKYDWHHHLASDGNLYELRTIHCSLLRQMGASTAIAHLFDVKKDIYIGWSGGMIEEFKNKLKLAGKDHKSIKYINYGSISNNTKIDEQVAKKLKQYFKENNFKVIETNTLETKNIGKIVAKVDEPINYFPNHIRGRAIDNDAVFYFDLGNFAYAQYPSKIYNLINALDKVYGKKSCLYVLT